MESTRGAPAQSVSRYGNPSQRRRATTAVGIGVVAGLLGGLLGVGGGIVIVPGLVALLGMDRRTAHGTSLAATLPIAFASFITYISYGNIDWVLVACLVPGAVVGAAIGAALLDRASSRWLTALFTAVVLLAALRLVLTDDVSGRGSVTVLAGVGLVAVGLLGGLLAGLLGIGGGVVLIPAMVVLFSVDPVIAKGTAVAVIVPTALIGTAENSRNTNADLRSAALIGPAGVISAIVGAVLADRLSPTTSNALFAALLLVVAANQLWSLRPSAADLPR